MPDTTRFLRRALSLLALAAALSLALTQPARANPFEHTLANGLRIVVKEDHRAPTAVHMVWYRAGSMDETSGSTGVAHVLEHLMFKGTPDVGPGEFSRRIAAAGGRDNAFTTRDYTAYFQQIPRQELALMMQLEADRMHHLSLDPQAFTQELKVVQEERRMRTEDRPPARLYEQLNAVAFQAHPYRWPVIGWMSDLDAMTVQDARAWYARWYVPNNAFLVIVGDVDHEAVFRQAEDAYGALTARPLPERRTQDEPPQHGIRRLTLNAPAELPIVVMAYKVPVLRDVEHETDPYALEVLAEILDGHDAARLPRRLVREQRLAVSAGASYDAIARGPGLFVLQGSPGKGKSRAQLEAALRAELARIAREGVSAAELERAKAQRVAAQIYKLDSMFAQAMEIGRLESAGFSSRDSQHMIEQLEAVRPEQVQAVAGRYFGDDALTVGELVPQPVPGSGVRPPTKASGVAP